MLGIHCLRDSVIQLMEDSSLPEMEPTCTLPINFYLKVTITVEEGYMARPRRGGRADMGKERTWMRGVVSCLNLAYDKGPQLIPCRGGECDLQSSTQSRNVPFAKPITDRVPGTPTPPLSFTPRPASQANDLPHDKHSPSYGQSPCFECRSYTFTPSPSAHNSKCGR